MYESVHFDPTVSPAVRAEGGGRDHVYVWAEVNGELAGWFLLDTGARNNLLSMESAEQLGLELTPSGTLGGVSSSVPAFRGKAETLRIGPMTLNAPTFVVADVGANEGRQQIGVLGGALLRDSVMVYDRARGRVSLFDPKVYQAPPVEWEECQLLNSKPFCNLKIEGREALLEIDTGAGQAVILCTPSVGRLGLDDGRASVPSELHGPYGVVPARRVTLDSFEVGAQLFKDCEASLGVEDEGWLGSTEHDGLIGGALLSHMVVIFDYGQSRISLTDRRLFGLLQEGAAWPAYSAYSAYQATGEPNAIDSASYPNAWFPSDETQKHWMELTYPTPVQSVRLGIWGSNSQQGLAEIHAINSSGKSVLLEWNGKVQQTLADGLALTAAEIDIADPIVKLRLDIDCSQLQGNNVIDAVGLTDAAGQTHWASEAHADGSLGLVVPGPFDASAALERHAARLAELGRPEEGAKVLELIE